MAKKVLDIKKVYNKKQFVVSKDKVKEFLDRDDISVFLNEESHWDNGESELVFLFHVKDNFS